MVSPVPLMLRALCKTTITISSPCSVVDIMECSDLSVSLEVVPDSNTVNITNSQRVLLTLACDFVGTIRATNVHDSNFAFTCTTSCPKTSIITYKDCSGNTVQLIDRHVEFLIVHDRASHTDWFLTTMGKNFTVHTVDYREEGKQGTLQT